MLIDDFNHTINTWINALDQYDAGQLLARPDPGSWSIGQVFMHLVSETQHYFGQIDICLRSDLHSSDEMKERARAMFAQNALPDMLIKGNPVTAENLQQPAGKQELLNDMLSLKRQMNVLWQRMQTEKGRGRTAHPGLGYFNALDWFRFAEMHMRHHLRQKNRIDIYHHKNTST
jgi:hypothetical protein